jgi:HlyD family secretion protein
MCCHLGGASTGLCFRFEVQLAVPMLHEPAMAPRVRHAIWLLPLLVAAAAGVWAFRARRGPRVDAVHAVVQPLVQTLVTSGRVVQRRQSELGALIQSTVAEILVDEGDVVQADALLVRLADDEARAALQEAEATVAEAEARLARVQGVGRQAAAQSLEQARIDAAQAQKELERQEGLFATGAVSEVALERARRERDSARSQRIAASLEVAAAAPQGSDVRAAAAALARAQARLRAAEVALQRTQIRAPSAGVVLIRHVEPNEVVRPGEPLLTFAGQGPLEIMIRPDESNLGLLQLGQPALVSPEAFPKRRISARVDRIAPSVNPLRGTVEVRLALDEEAELRPDMTVAVEIELGRVEAALVLPASLVRDLGSERPWALVVEDGVARRRELELGLEGDELVQIVDGLQEDEAVLATELSVEEGQAVRVRRMQAATKRSSSESSAASSGDPSAHSAGASP